MRWRGHTSCIIHRAKTGPSQNCQILFGTSQNVWMHQRARIEKLRDSNCFLLVHVDKNKNRFNWLNCKIVFTILPRQKIYICMYILLHTGMEFFLTEMKAFFCFPNSISHRYGKVSLLEQAIIIPYPWAKFFVSFLFIYFLTVFRLKVQTIFNTANGTNVVIEIIHNWVHFSSSIRFVPLEKNNLDQDL